ncbi:MAG: deoxyribonuclease V [Gammaproteobacteria bacterium]|nr:deoxyribonuclease V [Gammaproteobacteria bacterium]
MPPLAKRLHAWDVSTEGARAIQTQLRGQIITTDDLPLRITTVAGVDVGFEAHGTITRAAVALLSFPDLHLIDQAVARIPTQFPYIPGLLSFREIPALLHAFDKLQTTPDLFLCDGQGIAHPRRFGIAAHLGLLCDIPSIGVAKTRLIGTHAAPPVKKGQWVPLIHRQERIGAVLCTRDSTKPLYISSGHRISLTTAIDYVMACITRYRLPETTRHAHRLASQKTP